MGKESKEQKPEEKRFKIEVLEHEELNPIAKSKYLKATEFCKITSSMFRSVYADYDGCNIETDQQGRLFISAFFNHSEPKLGQEDPRALAISRDVPDDSNVINDTYRKVKQHDYRVKNGDRYFLTKEGKEGLYDFLADNAKKRDGTVNWNNIVADVKISQDNFINGYMANEVDTKVSLLDPAKIAMAIYGKYDEDGNELSYGVWRMSSLPQMAVGPQYQPDFMLEIKVVENKELMRVCEETGFVKNPTIDIVR